jgi:hypothetical protein
LSIGVTVASIKARAHEFTVALPFGDDIVGGRFRLLRLLKQQRPRGDLPVWDAKYRVDSFSGFWLHPGLDLAKVNDAQSL